MDETGPSTWSMKKTTAPNQRFKANRNLWLDKARTSRIQSFSITRIKKRKSRRKPVSNLARRSLEKMKLPAGLSFRLLRR